MAISPTARRSLLWPTLTTAILVGIVMSPPADAQPIPSSPTPSAASSEQAPRTAAPSDAPSHPRTVAPSDAPSHPRTVAPSDAPSHPRTAAPSDAPSHPRTVAPSHQLFGALRIIAPAAPGGGWDQTARVMQQALQQSSIVRTASVDNIPGAAGTIGLARFIGERGRDDTIMVSGLIMLGGLVTYRSPITLRDVTPIARLTGEYEVIVVPAASPHKTLNDVIRALKAHPESVSWGGGSAGGSDQILAGLVADAVGVSPRRINYIAFSGGGESLSAIIGGQVSVGINGLAELEPQIEGGTVRALGISSAERLPGLNVPTLLEQGVNVEFENWRSVVAPPGISRADRERLETAVAAMVQSPAWREAVGRYRWLDRYMAGDAFARFVDAEESRVRAILRQLGTGRSDASRLAAAGPYPLLVLAGLGVCGIASMFVRRSRKGRPTVHEVKTRGPIWLIAAAVAVNLLLAERAGFVVASAILFWLTARAFDPRHPIRDGAFALGTSVAAYLLFSRVLQLPLPAGILAGWI